MSSRTMNEIIAAQFPISFQLGVLALMVAVLIGIPLGVVSALKQNTFVDYLSMLQVLNEDYIRTARAKGLSAGTAVFHHALRNALIPVVTVLGPLFAGFITGSLVVESIFAIPGIGRCFVTSVTGRDYPVIMGTVLLCAVALIVAHRFNRAAVDITLSRSGGGTRASSPREPEAKRGAAAAEKQDGDGRRCRRAPARAGCCLRSPDRPLWLCLGVSAGQLHPARQALRLRRRCPRVRRVEPADLRHPDISHRGAPRGPDGVSHRNRLRDPSRASSEAAWTTS